MGGTFNPIHNGHLMLAQCSYEQFKLDKIWFMPSKNPPHKLEEYIENEVHRTNMIKRAIKNNSNFELFTFELLREGLTYTVDTLKLLKKEYKNTSFYFIMGEDSLFQIETWKNPKELFELTPIILARRGGFLQKDLEKQMTYIKNKYESNIQLLDSPIFEISSNFIRNNIKNGKSIKYYVAEEVEEYIYENKLYIGHGV